MKKAVLLMTAVILVIPLCLTACAKVNYFETESQTNTQTTTTTDFPETEEYRETTSDANGDHPSMPEVSVKIDGEAYEPYHEMSCAEIGGAIHDGYDIFSSNYLPSRDKVEYVHFCADSTLEITANGVEPQRIEVFDGETKTNLTDMIGKFSLSDLGENLYRFQMYSSLYISGNYVIKFHATTHGTGEFANEYHTEVYFVYITTVSDEPEPYLPPIDTSGFVCYKPVIYLYPTSETNITVKYVDADRLITTYPKYNGEWNMHVLPDGTMTDENGRSYYALYFDEVSGYNCTFERGFYVEGENAIDFLEEKLALLGFTERESNEFIMFWLPVLEANKHSLVYFEQTDERNAECPLEFSTNPDSILRVIIHIKAVDGYTEIEEQTLNRFDRSGFTVVEWGGTKY